MKLTKRMLAATLGVGMAIGAGPLPVHAQTTAQESAAPSALDEVVVTARRKEEAIQTVPIAIEALSGVALQDLSIKTLADLNKITTGLTVVGTTNPTLTSYNIRGQGIPLPGQAGTVAYFNDVGTFAAITPLFDLDNVQVLKGPQGVAFGKSTTGGAILFNSKKPTNEFGGYVDARVGNYNDYESEAAVNIPIVDEKVLLRLAGMSQNRDGYDTNLYLNSHPANKDQFSVRATLLLRPTDEFENTTVATYEFRDATAQIEKPIQVLNPAQYALSVPTSGAMAPAIAAYYGFPTGTTYYQALLYYTNLANQTGPLVGNSQGQFAIKQNRWGLINTSVYDLADYATFKNILGYTIDRTLTGLGDVDFTPIPLLKTGGSGGFPIGRYPNTPVNSYRVSDEAQVLGKYFDDKLQYTIGGYWETNWSPRALSGNTTLGNQQATATQSSSMTHAGYIDLKYALSDSLTLETGTRYTWDTANRDTGPSCLVAFAAPVVVPCASPFVTHATWEGQAVSYSVTLDWQVDDNLLAYIAHRKGYLQGGVNPSAFGALAAFAQYNPQTAKDIEIGTKLDWTLAGIKGRTDADMFHVWYDSLQVNNSVSVINNGVIQSATVITNVASAEITGIELQQTLVPSPWFDLKAAVTWQQGSYDSWIDQARGNLTGTPFPYLPRWKVGLMPSLHILPLQEYGDVTLSGNMTYTGRYNPFTQLSMQFPATFVNGYTLVDMRLDWKVMDTGLTASLACTNCLNRVYRTATNNFVLGIGEIAFSYGEPQMYFAELRYKF